MNRALAKELKNAGFPIGAYRTGHKFYPPGQGSEWSGAAHRHGVTLNPYDLEDRIQDSLAPVGRAQAEPGIAHLLVMHHRIVDRHRQMQFVRR
jgi:hypothetical protein